MGRDLLSSTAQGQVQLPRCARASCSFWLWKGWLGHRSMQQLVVMDPLLSLTLNLRSLRWICHMDSSCQFRIVTSMQCLQGTLEPKSLLLEAALPFALASPNKQMACRSSHASLGRAS